MKDILSDHYLTINRIKRDILNDQDKINHLASDGEHGCQTVRVIEEQNQKMIYLELMEWVKKEIEEIIELNKI